MEWRKVTATVDIYIHIRDDESVEQVQMHVDSYLSDIGERGRNIDAYFQMDNPKFTEAKTSTPEDLVRLVEMIGPLEDWEDEAEELTLNGKGG